MVVLSPESSSASPALYLCASTVRPAKTVAVTLVSLKTVFGLARPGYAVVPTRSTTSVESLPAPRMLGALAPVSWKSVWAPSLRSSRYDPAGKYTVFPGEADALVMAARMATVESWWPEGSAP